MAKNKPEILTDEELTPDEHKARAMLMGMEYYHVSKFPVYITRREDGSPDISSMIDANTLKSIFGEEDPDREHIVEHARKLVHNAQQGRIKI